MHLNSTLKNCYFTTVGAARITALIVWAGLINLGLLAGCTTDHDTPRATGTVALIDVTGKSVGTALLSENNNGVLTVDVSVTGLPPGLHGIHFHEIGKAEPNATPPFSTAGEHYNPEVRQHGLENPNGTHGGDLPNLLVDGQGNGTLKTTTNRVTLTDGPKTLMDANGSTLIIHALVDDQKTDPAGNSGPRIVGGVVVRN